MKNLLVISFALFLLPAFAAHAQTAPSDAQIVHLLNRIGYGPAPGDIEAVRTMGVDAYIEQQLHPENLPLPETLQSRLEDLPTINASMQRLAEDYQPDNDEGKLSPDERMEREKKRQEIVQQLSEAKILRAIASPAQLQEVMTDFWFNHFNVFFGKGADKVFTPDYERSAIRPYALGKFPDLLEATAHHPAMLFYLDNWQNTDPDSALARKAMIRRNKEIGINENYAREIMELHTLGVNGGYTQADVTTLAHILTGWGLTRGTSLADKAAFYFDPDRHDTGDKIFLGQNIRGARGNDGSSEIEYVIGLLARHPATAHHIAYQLTQYFVADEPPTALVDRLTVVYQQTDGDISAMLREIFHSPEFWDAKYAQNKFKPPFRFVVSALRAVNVVPPGDTRMLQGAIGQMGEPLYRCQTPNGYSDTNDQWLNSDALLKRINVAKSFARFFDANAAGTIASAFGNTWSANTLATVRTAPPQLQPALLIGSPEFLYY
jgi:uncharacterized protein (DUF1800 family)